MVQHNWGSYIGTGVYLVFRFYELKHLSSTIFKNTTSYSELESGMCEISDLELRETHGFPIEKYHGNII